MHRSRCELWQFAEKAPRRDRKMHPAATRLPKAPNVSAAAELRMRTFPRRALVYCRCATTSTFSTHQKK